MRFASLALPLACLAVTACVTDSDDAGGVAASVDALTGTRWTFVSIDGDDPASDKAFLQFREDGIGLSAGCNGVGGDWSIEDGRLIGGPYMSTQMYCEGLMEQEGALAALLEERPHITLMGERMALEGTGHRAQLKRAGNAQ